MKKPGVRSLFQDFLKRVNGNIKQERREGVSLPEAASMRDVLSRNPVEKHPGGGRGE
jgi:hypothetical protein